VVCKMNEELFFRQAGNYSKSVHAFLLGFGWDNA